MLEAVATVDVVQRFGVADPATVARTSLQYRTDSKFLMRESELDALLGDVASSYAVLRTGSKYIADYQTVYFDTPDLRCYHDHRLGLFPRYKVRVRHYLDRGLEFLEVKARHAGGVTEKHRRQRPFGADVLDAADQRYIEQHCDLPAAELRPRLCTRFRRLTLMSLDANERVTVDTDVRFRGEASAGLGSTAIVEVKQFPYDPGTPIMRALRASRACSTTASKYCTGIALAGG